MKRNPFLLQAVAAIALGSASLAPPADAQTATGGSDLTLSAATKKSTPARERRIPGQIACTVVGCHTIPARCHPETGYNWDGIPTGFDIVVCAPPRVSGH
jgi:hypothetical protein